MRSFQCVVLSALLQSAEYARHVFTTTQKPEPEEIGSAVAARVERQSLLYEPVRESVFLMFLLTEGVLRPWPGTPALIPAFSDTTHHQRQRKARRK
ncbi:Scr1 family TA system antitoxin-like transcriptional regulator [Streptomyces sp. NPDC004726]